MKTQTSHAAVGARKRGHDTQDDSITKFIVAAVMLFAILLVGGGVTVAIQLAGRTNVEEGGNGAIPVPDSLAKLEAKKVAEHVDEKVVRLARGSDAGDHVVKVGLSKEKLTRLTPTFGKVGLSLTEGEYDFKCAAGEITLDYSRAAAGPPNYVFVSIDEQEPIQIWCTQDAFQAHQVAEQTKQTEQDLKNLTTAGERAIGISAQQGKLVDNKTLIKLARDDSNLFLHLVNEDTKQLLTLVELQEPSENGQTHEIQRTSDGSQLVVFNVVKQNERERLLNVHDGRQAPHDSPSDHLEVKNALREARLAITYTAPSPTSGAQPVSETVEVWFSDEGRQAFTKRAEAEEQRQAADKARKELETKQTQAREKDQAAFSSLIQQVDEKTPVDVADGKLPTKITLASGVPDLQGLSMAFSCNPESGLSWKPAENADGTWELSAEAQPVARAAVGNDGLAIVIEPNLSPQDQARVAFARMTLSLKPNPSTWGDNPVSVTPASFRIASPLQLNWHGIVKPSELINKGAATVCTTVPPIARGLLELSNTQPELYPLTITLGDYPKAPENQPAFTIAPAESVPSRDNADLGTIVFAPAYPADMRTIRFCDLQKDRKNAPENAKTVDRDENEKWKWVDNFIRERDLPRPPPLGLRWRINRQIRDNDLCLSLEGPSRIVAIGNPEEPALYKGKFASQDGELPDALATYIANVLSAMQPERPLSARDATDVADKWINKNYNWLSPENKRIHVKDQLNYLKVLTFDDWLQGPIFLAALKACNQPELIEKKDYTPKPELQKEDNGNPFSLTYQKRVEDWETGTILEHVVAGFHDNLRTRCATLTASSDGEMTDDDKLVYFYAVANSLDYYLKAWDATKEELDRAPLTFTARVGVPGGDPENAETTGLIIDGDENH